MRSLYVTEYWPWPRHRGGRLRPAANVEALAALGSVDIVLLDRGWRHAVPDEPSTLVRQAVSLAPTPLMPEELAESERETYPTGLAKVARSYRDGIRTWLSKYDYDVVWCNRISAWLPLRGEVDLPCVIDVDDLQNRLASQRHRDTGDYVEIENAKRWQRLQECAALEADWLVVCSELDRGRLGAGNSSVVPNVYLDPAEGDPLPSEDPRPRILLQGLFTYEPNIDAAHRLVQEILPRVQRDFPQACVWLVGLDRGRLDRLAGDDVRVFGMVPDVRPYVQAADVVAVPLRQGSGTRLKLLESFTMGTPVVSTSLGAEGLEVADGEHLYIADTHEEMAEAIRTVLRDPALGPLLAGNARDLVSRRYSRAALIESVQNAVEQARHCFRHQGRECWTASGEKASVLVRNGGSFP